MTPRSCLSKEALIPLAYRSLVQDVGWVGSSLLQISLSRTMRGVVVSFFLLCILLSAQGVAAQHVYEARVVDEHHGDPLIGVNVQIVGLPGGAASNQEGVVRITDVPTGRFTIVFSYVGFETVRLERSLPIDPSVGMELIEMEESHEELDAIAVTATRSSRTIADEPTRVEVIAGEEIEEKIAMEPSNISMLLNESPGIFIQQTSAVSGGASIRIQGLDGRYTQMLKDGFPLYGGFSGGLSILQVPPLDLQQVEVIKGPSSTLYGGDAIAGLVNLVSKKPSEEPELEVLTNLTTAGGFDLGGSYRAKRNRIGVTLLATGNLQRAYDPDNDLFSNLPDTRRLTFHPTVYFYASDETTLSFGVSGTFEAREGGDMAILQDDRIASSTYIEENSSARVTSQTRLDKAIRLLQGKDGVLTVKNSVSLFDRVIDVPGYRFDGQQVATYSEASVLLQGDGRDLVAGADVRSDAFREGEGGIDEARDYTHSSMGVFAQDTWDVSPRLTVETGLRLEHHNTHGGFFLPRVSALVRVAEGVSSRIGGGLGYKAPSVFQEPSEERAFRGVLPLGDDLEAERSRGGSFDINVSRLLFDRVGVSINQAVYFTRISDPLVPSINTNDDTIRYVSSGEVLFSRAFETNAKFTLGHLKLFLGYVNLDARSEDEGRNVDLLLTPEHKTYTVLVYEKHGKGRIGLEGYWTGPQKLADGTKTDGYWVTGIMGQLNVRGAGFFVNFENILDTLQTDYSPVVLGARSNPRFTEVWAPMDGFIVNGGVKLML